MNLLFAEALPLRSTRDLGNYTEDKPLPHRLGDLSGSRFPLIMLSPTKYFVADHAMTVAQVFVDNAKTAGWEAAIESDGKGRSWTVVNFANALEPESAVSATGRGRLDDGTGALIENPGDVLAYIAQLAGRSERWNALRAEASGEGLRLAVSLSDKASIRTHMLRVIRSCGALWTPSMARLYPTPTVRGPVLELERFDVSDIAVKATLVDTCDVLRLAYDQEEATGRLLKHMEFTASPQRLGGMIMELALPNLRLPANAESVGRRAMLRFAGERFDVSAVVQRTDLRPGQWLKIVDHPGWPLDGDDPVIMVTAVEVAQNASATAITAEYVRSVPEIAITAQSVALPYTTGGIVVEFDGEIATFRISDPEGRPIKGARASLDGGLPRTTDAAGRVSFPATAGTHSLVVEAVGFVGQQIEIEL